MAHTVFRVTFDEGTTDLGSATDNVVNPWCQSTMSQPLSACGGHPFSVAVSPYSWGSHDAAVASEFNVESIVEWLLGLGSDGEYDATPGFPAMTTLFSLASNA